MSRDLEGDKHQVQKLRAHWEAVVCFKNKAGVGVGGGRESVMPGVCSFKGRHRDWDSGLHT